MVICLDEGHDHINNLDSKMVLDHLIFHVIFRKKVVKESL